MTNTLDYGQFKESEAPVNTLKPDQFIEVVVSKMYLDDNGYPSGLLDEEGPEDATQEFLKASPSKSFKDFAQEKIKAWHTGFRCDSVIDLEVQVMLKEPAEPLDKIVDVVAAKTRLQPQPQSE